MHVFGVRAHLLEGETVKGVGDHREVVAEVTRSGTFGEVRDKLRIAIRRDERGEGPVPVVIDGPQGLASEDSRREVTQGDREERRDQLGFDFAVGGIHERGARRGDGACAVRHVIGQALVGVDAATAF